MAQKKGPKEEEREPGKLRLRLEGFDEQNDKTPEVAITVLDREDKELACLPAVDGAFDLSTALLEKAHRILVGPPADDQPQAAKEASLIYRAADLGPILKTGVLDVGRGIWERWFQLYRCVSGSVVRCRRSSWWYTEVARAIEPRISIEPDRRFDLDELIAWPVRCSPICLGTVEVYRRVCCCEPWVFDDFRYRSLLDELRDLARTALRQPEIPQPPSPTPDPSPFEAGFLRGGAIDERALRAHHDLRALEALPRERVADYINARHYLLCRSYSCGSPVKVAEGTIGPDGKYNICWSEFPYLLVPGCKEEYAYRVRQKIGPFYVTIYNGVSAGHWYERNEQAELKSYHPWAIACRDNGGPGDAFVYLDEIGDTDSSLLATPDQDSATSVGALAANSGVAFPSGGPAGNGSHDRNWGGTLKLAFLFPESMRTIGAKFYRVSVTRSNANGDPVGAPEYVTRGLSWNKAVSGPGGVNVVPVGLGPSSTSAPDEPRDHLYEIPYDGDLGTNSDWESDQYHVYLDTAEAAKAWSNPGAAAGQPSRRHLLTLEVFDAGGQRLRPNGTPPTGLSGAEAEAAFTFRRKNQDTGPTDMVPFGALTHLFWWDNREEVSEIVDLRMNGSQSDEECQFLNGTAASTFGIGYRAYHPWELFQLQHQVWWKRGLSGGSDTILTSSTNVGVPPAAAVASPTHTFGHMLNHPVPAEPPHTKCAFTVFLRTYNKRTDGDNLGYASDGDSAAFAIDTTPPASP